MGSLNTDIIAAGVNTLLGPGELTFSGTAKIGPGGKSRNIAQMLATYIGKGKVAMIGKTAKDPFHLWSVPYNSLRKSGVHTGFISIESYRKTRKLPGMALIPVDTKGNNQIYVLPGINSDFLPAHLDKCSPLFGRVGQQGGFLGITLELPLETAAHTLALAGRYGIRTVLDPGGINAGTDYTGLLSQNIFLIKPNEHEAELLTGVKISDTTSAGRAAEKMFKQGVKNVLITHGEKGGYLITQEKALHIPVPAMADQKVVDTTGCGDQVTATLIAELIQSGNVTEATRTALTAGTLQATRIGIDPVEKKDIDDFVNR